MARTQEQRDERRKKLFANELTALRQAEVHWNKAADAWGVGDEHKAQACMCRARCAESKAARYRNQQELLNWQEDTVSSYDPEELGRLGEG